MSTEDHFFTDHNDFPIDDAQLIGREGDLSVAKCRTCYALTADPVEHAAWHDGQHLNRRVEP